jgi:HPt (histidine-containing phosphotransfer) domain-containing protein
MTERPVEIIHLPNRLGKKVGRVTLDPEKLAKAQAVVAALAQDYLPRLLEDTRNLAARWKETAGASESLDQLHRMAHDIKGQGSTFGYPLATAVASALCKLFTSDIFAHPKARDVVDAHIAALVGIASEPITGDGGPVGAALIEGLRKTREKLGLDA